MGAGQSTLGGPSGTADIGKFTLTPNQQQQLDVVSNLFQLLLEKNNIMNLAELVSMDQQHCNELIITLSANLDKEFQRIQLSTARGERTEVGFLSEKRYKEIQRRDDTRMSMCTQIARFLLQFVILVAALTSSVAIMDGNPDVQKVENLWVPEELEGGEEINPRILSRLVEVRLLKEVRAAGLPLEVYDFLGYNVHYKGFLYKSGTSSKVFRITVDYMRDSTCATELGPGSPSLPGSPGIPSSTGSRTGYSSWMTPDEERNNVIQQAVRAERLKAEEEKFKSQQLEKERGRLTEKLEIESSIRPTAMKLINDANDAINQSQPIIQDISNSMSNTQISLVVAETSRSPYPPTNSAKRSIYDANKAYTEILDLIRKIRKAIEDLKYELDRSVSKENIRAKYDALERLRPYQIVSSLNAIKEDFSRIAKEKQSQTAVGGAYEEYFYVTISPISEMQTALYEPQDEYRSGTTEPSPSAFPTNYASRPPFQSSMQGYRSSGGANKYAFIMDFAGNSFEADYFCKMRGKVSQDRSQPIKRRIDELFENVATKEIPIKNKAQNGSSILSKFEGFAFDGKAPDFLKTFGRILRKDASTIQSPAAQRAYLLASAIKDTGLQTKVCDDPWATKPFTEIPAFALLGSLYKNVLGETDNGPSVSATTLLKAEKFDNTKLYEDKVKEFCEKGISTKDSAAINIVKRAYGELKRLYGQQLEKVIEYMKQIFVVDRTFITALSAPSGFQTNESILRLNPRFLQNNANTELLALMQKVRQDLDSHYAQVESVYTKALGDLQKIPLTGGGRAKHKTRRIKRQHGRRYNSFRKNRVARR